MLAAATYLPFVMRSNDSNIEEKMAVKWWKHGLKKKLRKLLESVRRGRRVYQQKTVLVLKELRHYSLLILLYAKQALLLSKN